MRTIQELRARSNLSQAKFAEMYHIKLGTLQKWEQGFHKPSEYVLYSLSRLVNIDFPEEPSPEELLDPEESMFGIYDPECMSAEQKAGYLRGTKSPADMSDEEIREELFPVRFCRIGHLAPEQWQRKLALQKEKENRDILQEYGSMESYEAAKQKRREEMLAEAEELKEKQRIAAEEAARKEAESLAEVRAFASMMDGD